MSSWIPWKNRNSEPEQRIHQDLTEDAANRIAFYVNEVASRSEIDEAYRRYRAESGNHVDYFQTANTGPAKDSLQKFITEEELDDVLTLLEILLNELWEEGSHSKEEHTPDELLQLDKDLRRVLHEEGILLRIHPDEEQVEQYVEQLRQYNSKSRGYRSRHRSYDTRPQKDFNIHFEELANESVIESDEAVRALGKKERWEEELEPYNEAWEKYQKGQFSFIIPEKLYNSLEAVLVKICVEEQDWNNEGDGVSSYLDSLRENGLLEPSEEMVGEWNQILSGIQIGIQRAGGDRKRHKPIGQDYCILMLHQMGAFITFLVNRYEDEF